MNSTISYLLRRYENGEVKQRSRDFYVAALGATVNANPRPANEVRLDLNATSAIVLQRAGTPGHVDHIGLRVEGFDRAQVTRQRREAGGPPVDVPRAPGTPGFHIVAPDGFKVQLQ